MSETREKVRKRMVGLVLAGAALSSTAACVRGFMVVDPPPPPPNCPLPSAVRGTITPVEGGALLEVGPLPAGFQFVEGQDGWTLGIDGVMRYHWPVPITQNEYSQIRYTCAQGPAWLSLLLRPDATTIEIYER